MRKFKLIKEYPGSHDLGYTILGSDECFAAKYPEFWEEIIEKEYEILALVHKTSKRVLINIKDIKFLVDTGLDDWDIYSVKRLSDGEVFTVDDICHPITYPDNKHPINKIWFCDPGYLRLSSDNYTVGIKDLVKSKKLLLTTEDEVDIYEGDTYHVIELKRYKYHGETNAPHYLKDLNRENRLFKYFSTKEKAEEYIINNKPCLSYKEVCDNFHNNFGKCGHLGILKDLVKQKSNL